MKLYYFETMNPRKVCALAKHVGSPVSYERVDLREGAHKRAEVVRRRANLPRPLGEGCFLLLRRCCFAPTIPSAKD